MEITEKQITNLYHKVNEMMAELGAYGEINTRDHKVTDVMDALAWVDGGVYDEKATLKVTK